MMIKVFEKLRTSEFYGFRNVPYVRLKRINAFLLVIMLACILSESRVEAQDSVTVSDRFNIDLNLKNMHLWHGSVVTPGVMMASAMEYNSYNQKFTAGLWGGASFDGSYKEFSYYTSYRFTNNFNVSAISHNNYSNSSEVDIFSYDKKTSPNFVDVVLEYTVSEKVPLTLYWSTILFGNGGDFEVSTSEKLTNSYSNYAELRYTFFPKNRTQMTVFAGGAFSFITEKTFYSRGANMVNLGLDLRRDVKFLSLSFPVVATAFWNPESKFGALQLDISLF